MKKRFLVIAALIGLMASCREPVSESPGNPGTPSEEKTVIVFDNTQGICSVTVFNDSRRRDEDKIAEIPAGTSSQEIEWTPGTSVPFYFSYRISFKGISGFTLSYVPDVGKDQTAVRIDANKKITISIPRLEETLSSPDALLSNYSYILIQNYSSFSFQLHSGSSPISPDSSSNSAVVNSGERAQYTITPGAASPYRLLVGADYVTFFGSLASFEAGRVYSFVYDGSISLVSEIELKLENVAGVSPNKPVPQAPGTPVVTASDGLLTVRWTAVEGAETYEVYRSTTQNPPALPEKTVYSTVAVFTGLSNKTTYYVWIKAANENGTSDFSPRARGIPWPANEIPAIPGGLVIIPGINQLTVNWEECGGASSYEVFIDTTPSVPSEPAVTSEKTSAVISYLGNGNILENGVIYYIWVRAVNGAGKSGYSQVEAGTPRIPTASPAAPSQPVLIAGSRELTVSWQAVELAAAYEVWFGTDDDSTQAQKFGGDIFGGITETVITGLTNEQTYYVWIRAKNVVGSSGFGSSANAKTSAFVAIPETPVPPTIVPGNRGLSVSWTAVEGALFYEVWTGATNNPANAVKHGADISGTSTTLTDLVNGTTYYIWIKAKNNIGISEFSPVASGIPSASAEPPQAPQNAPSVISGNRGLTLSWQAIDGASAYELWAGTTPNPDTAAKRGNDVSALSGTITDLINENTYYVWIKAKNSKGTSGFSPMASGTPSITPGLYRGVEKIGNQNLSTALSFISINAQTGDDFYIVLGANESASPINLNYSGKTVSITLTGYGSERTITLSSNGSMFTVSSGVTLTLDENITLVGRSTNNASLVSVNFGNLVINAGTKISGNTTSGNGGGIRFSGGTITMNGGTISENTASGEGGGIYASGSGTITINGGTINGNTGSGGIKVLYGTTLTMNGGTISDNTEKFYGGIYVDPGGTAIINGGTITANRGCGIFVYGTGIVTMNGGTISGNTSSNNGGGIYVVGSGTVTMNGGTISGNNGSGGGIYVFSGTVTINAGIISGNTNNNGGGGIYVGGGTVTMNGGTINGNTSNNGGGGIYVGGGTITMNGGTISGNTGYDGGGVYVNGGTFTIHGGSISGNTASASRYGGGVCVNSGTFIMHGGTISGNSGYFGGGVYAVGTFKKLPNSSINSGIIYGSDAVGNDVNGLPLKNTANGGNTSGHAVYVHSSSRYRNTTAGQADQIDSTTGRGLSANGNAPYGQ